MAISKSAMTLAERRHDFIEILDEFVKGAEEIERHMPAGQGFEPAWFVEMIQMKKTAIGLRDNI